MKKKVLFAVIWIILISNLAAGQSISPRPIRTGTAAAPGTCTRGDWYLRTSTSVLYFCYSANTFTAILSGSGVVTSIAGTANQITASAATGDVTLSLPTAVTISEAVGASALTLTGATQTSSFPVINATQTWNNSGTTFTGIKLNVTNTASASDSVLADLQVGGSSVFKVLRTNHIVTPSTLVFATASGGDFFRYGMSSSLFAMHQGVRLAWTTAADGTGADSGIARNAAGVVEINNGAACSTVANCRDLTLRHLIGNGTAPTVADTSMSSCGTTAATIAGTDTAGRITVGATGGTSCTITFGTAYSTAPACVATNETTANLLRATATTTTVVIAGTMVAADKLAYTCIGY